MELWALQIDLPSSFGLATSSLCAVWEDSPPAIRGAICALLISVEIIWRCAFWFGGMYMCAVGEDLFSAIRGAICALLISVETIRRRALWSSGMYGGKSFGSGSLSLLQPEKVGRVSFDCKNFFNLFFSCVCLAPSNQSITYVRRMEDVRLSYLQSERPLAPEANPQEASSVPQIYFPHLGGGVYGYDLSLVVSLFL